jgi:hypothetical protein
MASETISISTLILNNIEYKVTTTTRMEPVSQPKTPTPSTPDETNRTTPRTSPEPSNKDANNNNNEEGRRRRHQESKNRQTDESSRGAKKEAITNTRKRKASRSRERLAALETIDERTLKKLTTMEKPRTVSSDRKTKAPIDAIYEVYRDYVAYTRAFEDTSRIMKEKRKPGASAHALREPIKRPIEYTRGDIFHTLTGDSMEKLQQYHERFPAAMSSTTEPFGNTLRRYAERFRVMGKEKRNISSLRLIKDFTGTLNSIERLIKECRTKARTKYLAYCDSFKENTKPAKTSKPSMPLMKELFGEEITEEQSKQEEPAPTTATSPKTPTTPTTPPRINEDNKEEEEDAMEHGEETCEELLKGCKSIPEALLRIYGVDNTDQFTEDNMGDEETDEELADLLDCEELLDADLIKKWFK